MAKGLKAEKWQIKQLTFNRHKTVDILIDRICEHLKTHGVEADKEALALVRQWLLVPYSLWDIDLKGFGLEVCRQIETVKQIDDELLSILNRLRELPGRKAQAVVAEVEKRMFAGDYDFCHTKHSRKKFELYELDLLDDPEWHADWKAFTDRYDVAKKYDKTGMLRRTLVCERNVRHKDWYYNGGDDADRNFKLAVDSLCAKYCLYGVQNGKPLLIKLSVNPTAQGTMLFIPRYWSFDAKRDILWRAVTDLQKAHAPQRQRTDKLEQQAFKLERQKNALRLKREAEARGLQGRDKHVYMCEGLSISTETDERTPRRWAEEAEKEEKKQ